jgi:hypothetical protein
MTRATGAIYYNNDPLSGFVSIGFDRLEGVPTYKATKEFLFNVVGAFLRRAGHVVRDGIDCIHVDLAVSHAPTTVFRVIHAIGEAMGGIGYRFTFYGYERQGQGTVTSERFNFEVSEALPMPATKGTQDDKSA